MAGCFPEKLIWCLIENICQGSKVNNPEVSILRYITTYFFYCIEIIIVLLLLFLNYCFVNYTVYANCDTKHDSTKRVHKYIN